MGAGRNSYAKTDKDATLTRMKEDHMRNGRKCESVAADAGYGRLGNDLFLESKGQWYRRESCIGRPPREGRCQAKDAEQPKELRVNKTLQEHPRLGVVPG